MKIAIISNLYPPYVIGGAEISTSILARSLQAMGNRVTVITVGPKEEEIIENGVKIYRLKNYNLYWKYPQREKNIIRKGIWHLLDIYNPMYIRKIRQLLSEINPDIVHTNNLCGISVVAWKVAKQANYPVIHTLRDYYLMCPQQAMYRNGHSCKSQCRVCSFYSAMKKKISSHVDGVVGISKFILDKHINEGYFSGALVKRSIPNSVSQPDALNKKGGHFIGYIGRLSKEKGIELMLDAFIETQDPTYSLILAGEGNKEYVQYLKNKYKAHNILFTGKMKIEDFFSRIKLCIVPSMWDEPFGRVVIEAFSCHIPVFLARNGGLQELEEEKISRSFDTSSKADLQKLLNDFFAGNIVFDDMAYEKVLEKYSKATIANQYMECYKEIINGSN